MKLNDCTIEIYRNKRWEMRCPNTGKKRRERERECLVEQGFDMTNIQRSMHDNARNAFGGVVLLPTLPNPKNPKKQHNNVGPS